jgi:hypothetical protein
VIHVKPQQLGRLSPSWVDVSHKNNPATKYSLTPNLTYWVLSRAVSNSARIRMYVFLVLKDETYKTANINVIKNIQLVVVVVVAVIVTLVVVVAY